MTRISYEGVDGIMNADPLMRQGPEALASAQQLIRSIGRAPSGSLPRRTCTGTTRTSRASESGRSNSRQPDFSSSK